MRLSRMGVGACTSIFIFVIGVAPALAQDGAGRERFESYGCFQCHGYEGQGGASGPRIAPSPYPYAAFEALVRRPANVMPAYSPVVLDDSDLRAIFDYVRSRPEPPPLEDIAALR